jgi:photosystem II stability/assembly factor-like uncharacterized protein
VNIQQQRNCTKIKTYPNKEGIKMTQSKHIQLVFRFITFAILLLSLVSLSSSQTWVSQVSGTTNTLRSVWFLNNQTGFTVGDAGTFRYTTNGGMVWTALAVGTAQDLQDIAFQSPALGIIVGDNGRVLRSVNGGTVWVQQPSGTTNNLRTVSFGANNMVYAAGVDGIIIRSADGGLTWTTVSNAGTRYRGSSAKGTRAWIVGDDGVITASINNGSSFTPQTSNTASDFKNIFMLDELTGYAGGQNSTLLYTVNGGTTWTSRNSGIFQGVNAIHFSNTNTGWVVCGAGAVYMTVNAGVSWANDNSGTAVELHDVYFPDINKGWTVGVNGTILHRSGTVGIQNISSSAPDKFSLSQNYPNPFNPSTKIKFGITKQDVVSLRVYDAAGRLVEELVNNNLSAGTYEFDWNAAKHSSGVYFYTIKTSEFSQTKKMLLVK